MVMISLLRHASAAVRNNSTAGTLVQLGIKAVQVASHQALRCFTPCERPFRPFSYVPGRSLSGVISAADYLKGCSSQLPSQPPSATGPARILDGVRVAAEWIAELADDVLDVTSSIGRPPNLRVILVGSRPDSRIYILRKLERCQQVGIDAEVHLLPATATQQELEESVRDANNSPSVDGVLVQIPLSPHMDEAAAMSNLHPDKDVDGFHPFNMGSLMMKGRATRLVPCTALGCLQLLQRSGICVKGKQVVVVGDSNIVGAPLSIGLLREHGAASVTVCSRMAQQDRQTSAALSGRDHVSSSYAEMGFPLDLPLITRTADILVVAVGHKHLVRAEWVKPGAVVLDVGINMVESSVSPYGHWDDRPALQIVGDVAFDEVSHVASALTPVPGGVGPMTVAAVVHNTLQAARLMNGLSQNK